MANSVIVYDDEYQAAAATLVRYGNSLIARIDRYCTSLKVITESAITDPRVAPRLQALASRAAMLAEPLENAVNTACGLCGQFVEAVDEADSFLG